jgi:small subunit ribosomal protein S3
MGQKVSPVGLRVGINRDWDAAWYADKTKVADLLHEDLKIRSYLEKGYSKAGISRVIIERVKDKNNKDRVVVSIYTSRLGVLLGKEGETKNKIVKDLQFITKKDIVLNFIEIKKPDLDATLVARNIAEQLENRASFRRVQKSAIQKAMRAGAKGAKTLISGRLGGAEMARSEGYNEGQVPLQTLRADVDYAVAEAHTTYGKLGIKVWIYKGEVFEVPQRETEKKPVRKAKPQANANAKKVNSKEAK